MNTKLSLVFGLVLASLIMAAQGTTRRTPGLPTVTRPRPTIDVTIDPTIRPPICVLPAVCARGSPRVCGRNPLGQCERYNNICELLEANRRSTNVGVIHVRDIECRAVRAVGGANRRPCYRPCPSRPVVCRQTPVSQHICVRTRNNRECKVLANRCQLRNQNCHARPRNNWLRTDRRRCGKLTLGDKPQACLTLPTAIPTATATATPTPRPTPRPTGIRRPTVTIITPPQITLA